MMGQVIKLPAPQYKGTQKRGPDPERIWMCTTCKSRNFNLEISGDVWCSNGHYIWNLRIK